MRLPISRVEAPETVQPISSVSEPARGVVRLRYLLWAAMAVILLLWIPAMLSFPFGRDQGILAWAGGVVLKGGMPYRDAWEVKGPTAILPFTLVQFLFGHNMWGIRLFDLALLGLATICVVYVARRWVGGAAPVCAAFVLLFTASSLDFWMTSQPDGWSGYILTFVIALLVSGSRWRYLPAGCCIGLCTLQKPLYGIYLLLLVPSLLGGWPKTGARPWRDAAAGLLGFAAPIGTCVAWFAWRGALPSFLDTFIGFNLAVHVHADELTRADQFRALVNAMRGNLPFSLCMPLAVAGGVVLLRRNRMAGVLFWLWLGLGFLLVIGQRKYLLYQWYPAMCAVSAGAGITIGELCKLRWVVGARREWSFSAGSAVLLWLAFVFLPTPALHGLDWLLYASGRWSAERYYQGFVFVNEDYFSYERVREVSTYLRDHTVYEDHVLVWGFDPLINYLSERPTVSRFAYNYPLLTGDNDSYEAKYRREFLQAVQAEPPTYVAIAEKDGNILVPESSDQALHRFPAFDQFVHARYRREKQIGTWELWRRVS